MSNSADPGGWATPTLSANENSSDGSEVIYINDVERGDEIRTRITRNGGIRNDNRRDMDDDEDHDLFDEDHEEVEDDNDTNDGVQPIVVVSSADEEVEEVRKEAVENNEVKPGCSKTSDEAHNQTFSLDDGRTCSICFDDYTNAGEHRLVCLKCGHLFGKRCIERWIKPKANRFCPTCKKTANQRDIRLIWSKSVAVGNIKRLTLMVDTSELESLRSQLTESRREAQESAVNLATLMMKLEQEKNINEQLRRRMLAKSRVIDDDENDGSPRRPRKRSNRSLLELSSQEKSIVEVTDEPTVPRLRITPYMTINICQDPQSSRCMSVSDQMGLAVVATCSPPTQQLWNGHGFKKINLGGTPSLSTYVHCHRLRVRDIKLSPFNDGLVMTASEDKSLKISSVHTNTTMQAISCPSPVWSCSWCQSSPNHVMAGCQNGRVYMYDTRMITLNDDGHVIPMCDVTNGTSGVPVTSIAYVSNPVNERASTGLLVGKLNQVHFYEQQPPDPATFRCHRLPLEGSLTSLTYDERTKHFLATYRPNASCNLVQHKYCSLSLNTATSTYSCQLAQQWHFGRTQATMTRNALMALGPDHMPFAATYDEQASTVQLWHTAGVSAQNTPSASYRIHPTLANMAQLQPIGTAGRTRIGVLGAGKLLLLNVDLENL